MSTYFLNIPGSCTRIVQIQIKITAICFLKQIENMFISSFEHNARVSFCDCPQSGIRSHFQTTSLKLLACFYPNFITSAQGGQKNVKKLLARDISLVAMATRYFILKNLYLRDRLIWIFFSQRYFSISSNFSKNFISLNTATTGRGHFCIMAIYKISCWFSA